MSSREARRPGSQSADEPPTQSPTASNQHNAVTLGPRDRVIGQLYIEGDLRVGGIVEGEVEVTGDVAIDDMANVKASVTARDVSISGHLVGAVVARKRLEVTKSGSLIGDVRVARLTIQDGATFSGKVSMGVVAAAAPAKSSEPKPVASDQAPARPPEAKPVTADPQAQTVTGSPAQTATAPVAQATTAPTPAAKAIDVAPLGAKPAVAPAPAAKMAIIPAPAVKAPTVPAPAAAAQSSGKDGKAKGLPPKGKPKRR